MVAPQPSPQMDPEGVAAPIWPKESAFTGHPPGQERMRNGWHQGPRAFVPALAGALVAFGSGAARGAAEVPCPPTVIVAGEAGLTGPVLAILGQHGVGLGPTTCGGRVVRVSLARDRADETLHRLCVDDGLGRSSDRRVA